MAEQLMAQGSGMLVDRLAKGAMLLKPGRFVLGKGAYESGIPVPIHHSRTRGDSKVLNHLFKPYSDEIRRQLEGYVKKISRYNAILIVEKDSVSIMDYDSKNGTYVMENNTKRRLEKGEEFQLGSGSEFFLGAWWPLRLVTDPVEVVEETKRYLEWRSREEGIQEEEIIIPVVGDL